MLQSRPTTVDTASHMHPTNASMDMSPPSTRHRTCSTLGRRACLNSPDTCVSSGCNSVVFPAGTLRGNVKVLRGRPAHPLRNVGDDHRAAQHRATFAHMAATLPPIGGTDAAVRSALFQSLRCLLTRIRIRIRAQSDTTHVSEHDGNHVRSSISASLSRFMNV